MKAIMYHYVRPDDEDLPYFRHLHIDDFVKQLEYFGNEYGFVSRENFENSLINHEPAKGVILTFDDGFKDHFRFVMPELTKRGLWGVFYIAASPFTSGRLIDVHRVHILLGKYGAGAIADSIKDIVTEDMLSHNHKEEFHNNTYPTQSNSELTIYVKRLLNYFIDERFKNKVIDELMRMYYPDEKSLVKDFYVNKTELREMAEDGMMIGSHTVNHSLMSKLTTEEQEHEISTSFDVLESIIGKNHMRTFCYPYGRAHSFNEDTLKLLDKYSCDFTFSVEPRDINKDDLKYHPHALPRYDCNLFPYGKCRFIEK